jgi:Na+/H+ antiporter NhaD/arsenite permease-like protein
MNRVIFQVGLLSFCISTVVFGIQGEGLMQTIARSFLVLTGVTLALAVSFAIASSVMRAKPAAGHEGVPSEAPPAAERPRNEKNAAQKA